MTFNWNFKWLTFLLVCNCLSVKSFSQSTSALPTYFNVQSIMPTSPDAAMLGRFGEIPIGYYTGTADISIPIYTIEDKEANFSLPVVLRYQSSGVKVEDQASIAGLGWSLEAEGSITQIVNGKEDTLDYLTTDDPPGYAALQNGMILGSYSKRPSIGTAMWPCGASGPGDSLVSMNDALSGDGQPDLYAFNFAGYSGKFYVNPVTHQPTIINQKDPITFIRTGVHTWKAITLDNNVFNFGILESAAPGQEPGYYVNGAGYTCKLSSVVLNDGKQITFGYSANSYEWFEYVENYHDTYAFGLNPTNEFGVNPDLQITYNNIQYLTNITANNAIINFNYVSRADLWHGTPARLNSIDILDPVTGRLTKTFRFYCDYFPYTDTAGSYSGSATTYPLPQYDTLGKRLRLDSVKEFGYSSAGDSIGKPPYKFYYDSSNILPLKTSFSQDYWGYYNGRNNLRHTPDLTFMRDVGCTGYSYANIPLSLLTFVAGGNRAPDVTKMATGILRQISYPTGGYTKFSYESNTFTNFMYPDQQKINAAANVGSIEDNNLSTDVTSTGHIIPNSGSPLILHLNARIARGINTSVTFDQLQPSYIQLVQVGPGGSPITVVNTWQMFDTSPFEDSIANYGYYMWHTDIQLPYDSGYYYVLTVSLPDALGPQASPGNNAEVDCSYSYYLLPNADRAVSYGGGLRIDTVQNYDENGNILGTKILRYINADSTSSGILMSPLAYIDNRPMTFVNSLGCFDNNCNAQTGSQNINFITDQSQIPYSDAANGNPIGYSRVEEINLAPDGTTNGKHVYYYHNAQSMTMIDNPDDPDLLNGSLTREEIWNAAADTLVTHTYHYADNYAAHGQLQPVFNGIKTIPDFYGAGPCAWPGGLIGASTPVAYANIIYVWVNYYPIVSNWYLLQSETSNYYYNGTGLSTTESYKYNMLGQMTEKDSYNSKGEPVATQYIHPYDTTGNQALLMEETGLLDNVLEERDWVNGVLMVKTDIMYGTQGGQVVKDSIVRTLNGNIPFTDISFNQYGPYKTVTQYTKSNEAFAVIWDYKNELPIAEVTNAAAPDIAYTSFEADGTGNWNIADTARVRNISAITGNLAYTLNSINSIYSQATNAAKTYIVSYWSTGGPVNVNGTTATPGATVGAWTYYEHVVPGGTVITVSGSATIDELRLFPQGSLMKTYTYVPLMGMSTECSPTNYIRYYTYDGLGRLAYIKDLRGNIVKTFNYHYQGQ